MQQNASAVVPCTSVARTPDYSLVKQQMAPALCTIRPPAATLWPGLPCWFLLLLTSNAAGKGSVCGRIQDWEQEAQISTCKLLATSNCSDSGEQVCFSERIQA